MVQNAGRNLYGTTPYDPIHYGGTVFQIKPTGSLRTIRRFCIPKGCPDGQAPNGLVQATDGSFYGTASFGGATGLGTFFRFNFHFAPFVKTLTPSGKVGATVIILGTNLTGATIVTFNGTAASFAVVSASEITATIPSGATTGKVGVTTPGGILFSNATFRVTQ